jgi:ribosomal protein S12 methylthiotransferase
MNRNFLFSGNFGNANIEMRQKNFMGKLAVVSLGCAKNLVDTEIMLGQLVQEGWEFTEDFSQADLILINTCGFIETAKKESITHILELALYKQPGKGVCRKLVVAGCLVQRYLSELTAEIPEVDLWLGLAEIGQIVQFLKTDQKMSFLPHTENRSFLNDQNLPRFQATLKHTAYVKIAEGCNHCCSYCAIPLIKGKFHSRTPVSIVTEIKNLVQNGVQEINLIAQDITRYGRDLNPVMNLRDLLETIVTSAKPPWLRLLYAYPTGVDLSLLQYMAGEPSICQYLDLPLQHINSRILKLMNRPKSPELIREKLALIRETVPGIALRTTFMVGFPSETEAEFAELLDFVKEGNFDHAGVFTYSREEGTAAYELQPQIDESVKEVRKQRLLLAQQKISAGLLAKQVDHEQKILIDQVLDSGVAVGRTEKLAPDVDGVVYLQNFGGEPGKFIQGLVVGSDEYNLKAKEILPTSTGIL